MDKANKLKITPLQALISIIVLTIMIFIISTVIVLNNQIDPSKGSFEECIKTTSEYSEKCQAYYDYEEEKNYKDSHSDPIFQITPYRDYYEGGFMVDSELNVDNSISVKVSIIPCSKSYRADAIEASKKWLQENNITEDKYHITQVLLCEDIE